MAATHGAIGAIILLATASPAFAGGYWDGDRGEAPDYSAYQRSDCPPPPCPPCWRERESDQREQGWDEEQAPPRDVYEQPPPEAEDLGPPPADYVEGGVGGPEFIEEGGGFEGGAFQPGLAIGAQFDFGFGFGGRDHVRFDRQVSYQQHAQVYQHASAYGHSYARTSYGRMSNDGGASYGHASYSPMRAYSPMRSYGQPSWGRTMSYGHATSYHPMAMGHAYKRR